MKKSISKLISFTTVAMLAATLLSGCNSAKPAATKVTSDDTSLMNINVYLNYSWWTNMPSFDNGNLTAKWIMDNEHVKMNFQYPTGDEREKLNLLIATDSIPDVVVLDRNDMYQKLISLKKVIPIDGYINKYGGYKSMMDKSTLDMSKVNGKTYGYMNWPMTSTWQGFAQLPMINQKIYKQLGSPKIETLDDLYSYLKVVKNANIMIDGKSVVPLQFSATAAISDWLSSYGLKTWGNFLLSDGKIVNKLTDPTYAKSITFSNKLYREGLINKDAFVEKQEQVDQKISTGRVAVLAGATDLTKVQTDMDALKAAGSDVTYTSIPPFRDVNTDIKDVKIKGASSVGWDAVVISSKAKNPDRIAKFLDWMASADGQRVMMYGPKGQLWDKIDSKGYPILIAGKTLQQTPAEQKLLPLAMYPIIGMSTWYDQSKLAINRAFPADKRSWSISQQDDSKASSYTWDATEFEFTTPQTSGTPEQEIETDIETYLTDAVPKMLMSTSEEGALKNLDQINKDMSDKGYQKVLDYANKQLVVNKKALGIK